MLAEAGTTCPRAPSGCVCALSRPRWERLSQSAIWNGRIALSALRPAGDRCREMQACSTLVHHITSMRGVAPYKRQTQLHEHRRQNQNPQIRYSADSTVSQASRPGCGEGNRCATPRNRPAMLIVDLCLCSPSCNAGRLTNVAPGPARRRGGALSRFVSSGT